MEGMKEGRKEGRKEGGKNSTIVVAGIVAVRESKGRDREEVMERDGKRKERGGRNREQKADGKEYIYIHIYIYICTYRHTDGGRWDGSNESIENGPM
jgi:hypothetical protein